MSESKKPPGKLWLWPLPLALLVQLVLPNYFPHLAPMTFFSVLVLVLGAAFLISAVLLRFVDLPRAEANPGNDPDPTIEYQRAIVGPFLLLGVLLMGLGGAFLVLPDDPTARNAAFAVFALLGITALMTILVRAWRIFVVRPGQE